MATVKKDKRDVAVGLFSGGLDSSLAVKIICVMGFDVIAFHVCHPFETGGFGRFIKLREAARRLGARLYVEPTGPEFLEVVRSPRHGYGRAMNPCIDCHAYMVGRAAALARRAGAAFVFTGEVLGSRPMSQRREALDIVERESGLVGRLLRPLSARLLPPTEMEEAGLVDRERLYAMKGRSRKVQMKLADEFGITGYPTPAGGCLLTDDEFSARLREEWAHGARDDYPALVLLRIGRHFRLPGGGKAVVGRNEEENARMGNLAAGGDIVLEVGGVGSPVTLLRRPGPGDLELAAGLTVRYADAPREGALVNVGRGPERTTVFAEALGEDLINRFRVSAEKSR